PMHKKRLFKRQYNQATLLAQGIQRTIGIDLDIFSLKRTRKTAPQLGKSAAARKKNLTEAFYADPTAVVGKNIILIDDVWTTGSTADACAKCLKQAGALRVDVVTICFVENAI
ncbi:MAG: ComF family protein, partial [Alphaproteobacteria bacterium]